MICGNTLSQSPGSTNEIETTQNYSPCKFASNFSQCLLYDRWHIKHMWFTFCILFFLFIVIIMCFINKFDSTSNFDRVKNSYTTNSRETLLLMGLNSKLAPRKIVKWQTDGPYPEWFHGFPKNKNKKSVST